MNDDSYISRSTVEGVLNGPTGRFTMNDRSSIRADFAGNEYGCCGVFNLGVFRMNGKSSVRGQNSHFLPGVVDYEGRFVMTDASSITGNINREGEGGGVRMEGGLFVMRDASHIRGNAAPLGSGGGGIYHRKGTLVGVVCGPGGNVYGNTPDDCFFE